MFASRSDLLARSNAERIAQLAVPADKEMPAITLRAAINGEDLSGYPEVDQETITLALDTIDKCLSDADALLISYGIPADVQSSLLARLSSTVAVYYLYQGERVPDAVQQAYDDVIDQLTKFSKGLVDLLPPDSGSNDPDGVGAIIESAPPRFGFRRPQ